MTDQPALAKRSWFVRSIYAGRDLELFIVTAIAALVVAATGRSGVENVDFWSSGQAISSGVSAVLIVVGFVRWRRSRLAAYRWFQRALLVTIFVTEFFAIYQNQVAQVFGLFVVLLTYAALRAMMRQEEARERAGEDIARATRVAERGGAVWVG